MTARPNEERLFAALVTLADSLVSDFDPVDLADRLVSNCLEHLPIASAGILLSDFSGGLRVLASSSEEIHMMEILESQSGQGACVLAVESGEIASVLDPQAYADRWPEYVQELHILEVTAAYAIPMRLRESTIGAVNLFCTDGQTLGEQDGRIAQLFATLATLAILTHRSAREQETLAEQLQTALTSRVAIEQAKGVLAEREGLPMGEAFNLLRSRARSSGRTLTSVAREVVTGGSDRRPSRRERA